MIKASAYDQNYSAVQKMKSKSLSGYESTVVFSNQLQGCIKLPSAFEK